MKEECDTMQGDLPRFVPFRAVYFVVLSRTHRNVPWFFSLDVVDAEEDAQSLTSRVQAFNDKVRHAEAAEAEAHKRDAGKGNDGKAQSGTAAAAKPVKSERALKDERKELLDMKADAETDLFARQQVRRCLVTYNVRDT